MTYNTGRQAFLALLTFIAFIVPLIIVDEVSLLTSWLFIFISWAIIILLSALTPSKDKTVKSSDITLKD